MCATTSFSDDLLGDRRFQLAVIDEACQSTEPGCVDPGPARRPPRARRRSLPAPARRCWARRGACRAEAVRTSLHGTPRRSIYADAADTATGRCSTACTPTSCSFSSTAVLRRTACRPIESVAGHLPDSTWKPHDGRRWTRSRRPLFASSIRPGPAGTRSREPSRREPGAIRGRPNLSWWTSAANYARRGSAAGRHRRDRSVRRAGAVAARAERMARPGDRHGRRISGTREGSGAHHVRAFQHERANRLPRRCPPDERRPHPRAAETDRRRRQRHIGGQRVLREPADVLRINRRIQVGLGRNGIRLTGIAPNPAMECGGPAPLLLKSCRERSGVNAQREPVHRKGNSRRVVKAAELRELAGRDS